MCLVAPGRLAGFARAGEDGHGAGWQDIGVVSFVFAALVTKYQCFVYTRPLWVVRCRQRIIDSIILLYVCSVSFRCRMGQW